MKNLVVTLDINYPKEITDLTFPYMQEYAKNINADFRVITERKYPDLPLTLEKFQIKQFCSDYEWIFFLDADCLINPGSSKYLQLKSQNVVYISQKLPLTQFNYKLKQHVPTYFFGFNKKYCSVLDLPLNCKTYEKFVNHNNYERRIYLLDDLLFNINLSLLKNVILKQPINLIAHLGKESCSIIEKINFLKYNIETLKKFKTNQIELNYE